MSMLHASPERHAERRCAECGAAIPKGLYRALFCRPEHRATFHNRQTVRGRTLVPLIIANRITRGGSRGDLATGRYARLSAQRLIDRWAADDRAEGRMSMVEYVRRRTALGYER